LRPNKTNGRCCDAASSIRFSERFSGEDDTKPSLFDTKKHCFCITIMNNANIALMRAARSTDLELLELAIKNGADIDELWKNSKEWFSELPRATGNIALYAAINSTKYTELTDKHLLIVARLLEVGVDVNKNFDSNPYSYPIHAAVETGHDDLVRLLLKYGATLFVRSMKGSYLLRNAAGHGMTWLVERWLNSVPESHFDSDKKYTLTSALIEAAGAGSISCAELLLEAGAEIDILGFSMSKAVEKGHPEMVVWLRANGAATKSEYFPNELFIAAAGGKVKDLDFELLEGCDDPEAPSILGYTALGSAAYDGNDQLARELVARGVEFDAVATGVHSILFKAAYGGMAWLVQHCLDAGADIRANDENGRSLLMTAIRGGYDGEHVETVRLVIERGADINYVSPDENETALHAAIYRGNTQIIRLLLDNRADFNAEERRDEDDEFGGNMTPLMINSTYNDIEISELLIEAGADVMAREGTDGRCALHYAAQAGMIEAINLLLRHGVDVNVLDNRNKTPLMYAIPGANEADPVQTVGHLLQQGANLHARDCVGDSALHLAAHLGLADVVRLLLNAGADWNSINEEGKTPLMVARDNFQYVVVEMLEKLDAA
jgi:ankyrin repeat protein